MSYATGSHTVFHHRTELEKLADAAKPINRHKSMKVNGGSVICGHPIIAVGA